mmetsp:Transcript_84340/g.243828  ORF Transcript_84340/g.243828 Transcript_84340/m.243828 type:complete len:531 (-) Transcript_84340:30-1622(-)
MQSAIDRTFADLDAKAFPKGVRFMCAEPVMVPAGLRDLWINVEDIGQRLEEELSEVALEAMTIMVAVCNVFDAAQISHVVRIADWLSADEAAPPVVLLPLRPDSEKIADKSILQALKDQDVMKRSLDDFIFGEPVGFALSLAIHSCIAKAELKVEQWLDQFRQRSIMADDVRELVSGLDATMWQYIPQRLQMLLPPVDYELGDSNNRKFAGYAIQQRLPFGADELLYKIDPPAGVNVTLGGEMVKVVPKSRVARNVDALRRVQRSLQIMQTLSDRWSHPNLARGLQIYHSPTCLYMRMESAGTESLCLRLKGRDAGTKEFTEDHMKSVTRQLADVIRHLHSGPNICHRDLKPENIALSETGGELHVKLVSFDTAAVQLAGGMCKLKSGTFPFAAPEVANSKYDGKAADMWSMGVLFLEMACGVGIVERTVCLSDFTQPDAQSRFFPKQAMANVRDALSSEAWLHRVFEEHGAQSSSRMRSWFGSTVLCLNRVNPALRWTSLQLWQSVEEAFAVQAPAVVNLHGAVAVALS